MRRQHLIWVPVSLLSALILAVAFFGDRYLCVQRQRRESHFIAIHFIAAEALREREPSGPKSLDSLIKPYGGTESGLNGPFPDGLLFSTQATSFVLEEPTARLVSLFHSDRLIATDRQWPHWEASGVYAKKFKNQQVPPVGYE